MTINFGNLSNSTISTYSGINDIPEAPSPDKAGNGSHLIEQHNILVQSVKALVPELLLERFDYWHDIGFANNPRSGLKVIAQSVESGQYYGFVGRTTPPDLEDTFSFFIPLKLGYYRIKILGVRSPAGGMLSVIVNNKLIETIDFYATQGEANWIAEISTLNVNSRVQPGITNFVFKVSGKNDSSTGYVIPITKISVYPHGV